MSNSSMSYGVPPFMVQYGKIISFSWPYKKVKKISRSKQQVLCTTTSSWLTVETMIEGQCQMVQGVMVSLKSVSDAQTDARRTHGGRTVCITRSLPAYAWMINQTRLLSEAANICVPPPPPPPPAPPPPCHPNKQWGTQEQRKKEVEWRKRPIQSLLLWICPGIFWKQ